MMNFCLVIYLTIIYALLPHNFHPFVRTCTTAAMFELFDKKIAKFQGTCALVR